MNLDWALQEGNEYFSSLLNADAAECWLAESISEGEVVGYLAARLERANSLRPVRVATLESMYVRAERRGLNAGAKLVEQFLLWAGEQKAHRASVTAYAANADAIRFYEREGFSAKNVSLERSIE